MDLTIQRIDESPVTTSKHNAKNLSNLSSSGLGSAYRRCTTPNSLLNHVEYDCR